MADADQLYLPVDFEDDLGEFLRSKSFAVISKPRKLAKGQIGKSHKVSKDQYSISILEAPYEGEKSSRFLLCIAARKERALLMEIIGILQSVGARPNPE